MRLYEITNNDGMDSGSIQTIQHIKQACQIYLNHKHPRVNLYRGANSDQTFGVRTLSARPDSFSGNEQTKQLHDLMIKDGFKATRLNGYFTFPSINQVERFSSEFSRLEPYVVFPSGNYDLTWHDVTGGLRDDNGAGHWLRLGRMVASAEEVPTRDNNLAPKMFWEHYKKYYHHGKDVLAAVSAMSEILVSADKIYLINYNFYKKHQQQINQILYP